MVKQEREGRAQRRAEARIETKARARVAKKPFWHRPIKRREVVLAGAGIVGVALAGTALTSTEPVKEIVGVLTHRSSEISPQEARRVIEKEIKRLKIKQSTEEVALWRIAPSMPVPIRDDEITEQRFYGRLNQALSLMRRSQVQEFRNVAEFVQNLHVSGELEFQKETFTIRTGNIIRGLHTDYGVFEDGTFGWIISASADEVINKLELQALATLLVHELTHVKDMRQTNLVQKQILTPNQRVDYFNTHFNSLNNRIAHESGAYAKQAEAFLNLAGLYGGFPDGTNAILTATYIQSNRNPANPQWIDQLKRGGHLAEHLR